MVKTGVMTGSVRASKGSTFQWPFQLTIPAPSSCDDVAPPSYAGFKETSGVGNMSDSEEVRIAWTLTTSVRATKVALESPVDLLVGSAAMLPRAALEFCQPHEKSAVGERFDTCCGCGSKGSVEYKVQLAHRVGLAGSRGAAGSLPLALGLVAHTVPIASSAVFLKSRIIISHQGVVRTQRNFISDHDVDEVGDFKDHTLRSSGPALVLGIKKGPAGGGRPQPHGPAHPRQRAARAVFQQGPAAVLRHGGRAADMGPGVPHGRGHVLDGTDCGGPRVDHQPRRRPAGGHPYLCDGLGEGVLVASECGTCRTRGCRRRRRRGRAVSSEPPEQKT